MNEKWKKSKKKLATIVDIRCARLALGILALQRQELEVYKSKEPGTIDQLDLSRMMKTLKDAQEMGRIATADTEEQKQKEFEFVVRYESPRNTDQNTATA